MTKGSKFIAAGFVSITKGPLIIINVTVSIIEGSMSFQSDQITRDLI